MILDNSTVKIKEIMLDPFNPRFIKHSNISQSELLQKILGTRDAKEILTSMVSGIKWVNRIVIMRISNLNTDLKKLKEKDDYKYIVVEGNTRLACLKSGKITEIDEDDQIPVLIAKKERNESLEHFQKELRITQGIANVMVVKEWKPIAKARHLYKIIKQKIEEDNTSKIQDLYKEISQELGIGLKEVRTSIIRYAIYTEISKESDTLEEDHWPYLEAFEQNEEIRTIIGMKKNSISFEWEDEQNSESLDKHELLNDIPSIIKSATKEGIQTKKFRDIFKTLCTKEKKVENIRLVLNKISDPDENSSWKEFEDLESSQEEEWEEELDDIYKKINSFPSGADWANIYEQKLIKIKEKLDRQIQIIKNS